MRIELPTVNHCSIWLTSAIFDKNSDDILLLIIEYKIHMEPHEIDWRDGIGIRRRFLSRQNIMMIQSTL